MEKPFKLVKISYDQSEYLALLKQKSKEKIYHCFINKKLLFPNVFNINVNFKIAEPKLQEDVILKPNIKEYITYALNIKAANLLQMEMMIPIKKL